MGYAPVSPTATSVRITRLGEGGGCPLADARRLSLRLRYLRHLLPVHPVRPELGEAQSPGPHEPSHASAHCLFSSLRAGPTEHERPFHLVVLRLLCLHLLRGWHDPMRFRASLALRPVACSTRGR